MSSPSSLNASVFPLNEEGITITPTVKSSKVTAQLISGRSETDQKSESDFSEALKA